MDTIRSIAESKYNIDLAYKMGLLCKSDYLSQINNVILLYKDIRKDYITLFEELDKVMISIGDE